jgi:hypothetical protein
MSSRGMWTVISRRREIMRDNDNYVARNHGPRARRVQRIRDVPVTVTSNGHGLYLQPTAHQPIDALHNMMLHKSITRCRIVPIVRGLCSHPLRKYTPGRVCVRVRQLRPARRSSLVEGHWLEY